MIGNSWLWIESDIQADRWRMIGLWWKIEMMEPRGEYCRFSCLWYYFSDRSFILFVVVVAFFLRYLSSFTNTLNSTVNNVPLTLYFLHSTLHRRLK